MRTNIFLPLYPKVRCLDVRDLTFDCTCFDAFVLVHYKRLNEPRTIYYKWFGQKAVVQTNAFTRNRYRGAYRSHRPKQTKEKKETI
jgi:hypothetical protein